MQSRKTGERAVPIRQARLPESSVDRPYTYVSLAPRRIDGVSVLATRSRVAHGRAERAVSKITYSRGCIGFYFAAKSTNLSGPRVSGSLASFTLFSVPRSLRRSSLTLRVSTAILPFLLSSCIYLPRLRSRREKFRELRGDRVPKPTRRRRHVPARVFTGEGHFVGGNAERLGGLRPIPGLLCSASSSPSSSIPRAYLFVFPPHTAEYLSVFKCSVGDSPDSTEAEENRITCFSKTRWRLDERAGGVDTKRG